MKVSKLVVSALVLAFCTAVSAGAAELKGVDDFKVKDGVWMYKDKPFYSTSAHAIFHKFRTDRQGGIEELKGLKAAGFTAVEVYWQWHKDLDPATNTFTFKDFDEFVLESKKLGLKNFCMFAEYNPQWLADKLGWGHTSELGTRDARMDDFFVCNPSFQQESKRFYVSLIEHLKENPEISENILYYNMGGEYKPFRPIRQMRDIDYGYDDYTVGAFRKWMEKKGWTPKFVEGRWGANMNTYNTWEDVWPAVNLKKTDYKDNDLKNHGLAKWDWFEFRQEIASQHMVDAVRWLREAGETRPLFHEYNTVTPGGLALFLDWSRAGARKGKDGIHLGSGTFDREFDYSSLLFNLGICRGASDPPWQSNEQGGMTSPEWMKKHAWFMIGMGGTGIHYWDWRSKDWGLLNMDGSKKEGYAMAVHLNAQIEFLGDLLKASKPMPNRIGVLLLAEETLYAQWGHNREWGLTLKALLEQGSGCEVAVITDDTVLNQDMSGYRLIITPGQARMRKSVMDKLAAYVENGGTLWLMPGSAVKNEADQDILITPAAPLDAVAGARTPATSPLTITGGSDSAYYCMFERSVMGVTAKPIAMAGNQPAIWMNKYGKGLCFYQPVQTAVLPSTDTPLAKDPDALAFYLKVNSGQSPAEIVQTILAKSGISPYMRAFTAANPSKPLTTVITAVRKADPGYLLFLIEGDNRTSDVLVKLNAKRLGLSGKWAVYCPESMEKPVLGADYTFRTTMKPSEVKILHLVPDAQAVKWMTSYKKANWPAIQAKLPQIPPKELVPPSEIGKFEPGDLKDIKPKPYGDKWLLVDLSKHVNRSLVDEGKMENAKAFLGSIGTGDNDLAELPKGIQTFIDVPFNIIDPKDNKNSCMITKTGGRPWLGPLEFKGIPVKAKIKKMHWLYGTGWAHDGLPVGYITYHYSDGTVAQENLIAGRNVHNWWGYAGPLKNPKARLAWSGSTPASRRNFTQVGLYQYYWENPYPEKTVESVDINSYGGDACIIVVAMTGEK